MISVGVVDGNVPAKPALSPTQARLKAADSVGADKRPGAFGKVRQLDSAAQDQQWTASSVDGVDAVQASRLIALPTVKSGVCRRTRPSSWSPAAATSSPTRSSSTR